MGWAICVLFLCSRGPSPARSRSAARLAGLPSGALLGPQALFVENPQELSPWNAIVRTLPLAFDFDAVLRRRMTEPKIDARQRALPDFRQHLHVHAGLFVGGRVSRRIGVTAGEAVDDDLRRVH